MKERISAGLLALIVVMAMACGCNSQTVKPSNELETNVKASLKSQQEMKEKIEVLNGNMTKVQQSISTFISNVTTVIQQQFETMQGSQKQSFENFTGEMKTVYKSSTNTTAYGIGLVATVLLFALALIWIMAKTFGSAAVKLL